jgi:ketosteroid isomerase-like protein
LSEISRDNAALARRLWTAASQGSPDPVVQLDPKIVWKSYGHGPEAGEFHGIDAVLEHLASFGAFVDDVRSELLEVLSNESGAVIRYRAFMTRGTKRLDCDYSLWLTIEDGVVKRAAMVPFEDETSDAFWRVD